MKKVVIIGGVAGGASAAARLRRVKEDFDIIILERGPYVSFANCGLPYYVGNVIKTRNALKLVSPTRFLKWFNIDVKINNEVISIDRDNKRVQVRDLINHIEYFLDYDYIVLSPGSIPIKPQFPGINDVPVFTLSTIPDAVSIREYVEKNKVNHATIVGGGFIGLEMAENLIENGVKVKIVEMLDQVMPPLDKEMAQFINQELILNGVCLVLDDPVDSFGRNLENKPYVKTKSGRTIETDLIILSIGIRPVNQLAKDANLNLSSKGYIIVNKYMQSSDPSIYTVGDAVQVQHFQTKKPTAIALAGPANKQGRIAADNIAGRDVEYDGILGASVVKVFYITVAYVGLTEKMLKNSEILYDKIYIHPNNHAGYYPEAIPMAFKLIFEKPTGKILGVQIVGGSGSEKRVDVISTLIKMGGTVFDLERLELTYAPPFSSAKDPVNMAGFVAANYLRGDMPIWHWHDIDEFKENGGFLLDVRTPEEFKARTIERSVNIPLYELRERMNEIPKGKPIVTFCEVGYRSYLATRILLQHGFNEVYELTGGYKLYEMANITNEEIIAFCGGSEEIMHEFVKEKAKETEDMVIVDACGLSCPGPLNAMIKSLETLPENKKLKIIATDPGFKSSVEAYTKLTEAIKLLSIHKEQRKLIAILQKGEIRKEDVSATVKIEKKTREELRGPDAPPISEIEADDLYHRLNSEDSPAILIDVRSPEEYFGLGGHIKDTIFIPLGELMDRIDRIEDFKNNEIVTICHSGARSMMAARLLGRVGFKDIRNLKGGMMMWHRKGYPVVTEN